MTILTTHPEFVRTSLADATLFTPVDLCPTATLAQILSQDSTPLAVVSTVTAQVAHGADGLRVKGVGVTPVVGTAD